MALRTDASVVRSTPFYKQPPSYTYEQRPLQAGETTFEHAFVLRTSYVLVNQYYIISYILCVSRQKQKAHENEICALLIAPLVALILPCPNGGAVLPRPPPWALVIELKSVERSNSRVLLIKLP